MQLARSLCVRAGVGVHVSVTGHRCDLFPLFLGAVGSQSCIDFQRRGSAAPSVALRTHLCACRVNIFNI